MIFRFILYVILMIICIRLLRRMSVRTSRAYVGWLYCSAVMICSVLVGCKEKDTGRHPERTRPQKIVEQTSSESSELSEPSEQDVRVNLLPLLADYPMVKLGEVQMTCSPQEDGSIIISVNAAVCTEENLYRKEEAPPVFNVERKEVNSVLNRAMLPEASYLLQVGADPEMITDEDRTPKALPEELGKQAEALKHIAEGAVYRLYSKAGSVQRLPASMRVVKNGTHREIGDISFDTSPLYVLQTLIPERALPADAVIVSEHFEEEYRTRIREMVNAFNEAAQPYIEGREAGARSRMLEAQARKEEAEKVRVVQEERQRICREAWQKICTTYFTAGAVFTGEWSRETSFGKFLLRISDVASYTDALQFIGILSVPNLPEASLNVVGRCQPSDNPDEPVPCIIHIYHGRYDPDVPTAEIFDKHDAQFRLIVSAAGALTGTLTSESREKSSGKEIRVQFQFVKSGGGK